MFEENPRPDTSRPEFRFPISGYSYGAARQSYEFGAAAHGLPTGCHSPGGWVALVVTVFAQAYEFSRSRRPGLRRYADVHGPLAEVHRARSHSGSVIAVIAWTATLTHPSGAPLGHGKVR